MPNRPMGPQPKTATLLPLISSTIAPCTATPIGSSMAPRSGSVSGGSFQQQTAGMLAYSAKTPGVWTPTMAIRSQTCWLPVWHW